MFQNFEGDWVEWIIESVCCYFLPGKGCTVWHKFVLKRLLLLIHGPFGAACAHKPARYTRLGLVVDNIPEYQLNVGLIYIQAKGLPVSRQNKYWTSKIESHKAISSEILFIALLFFRQCYSLVITNLVTIGVFSPTKMIFRHISEVKVRTNKQIKIWIPSFYWENNACTCTQCVPGSYSSSSKGLGTRLLSTMNES